MITNEFSCSVVRMNQMMTAGMQPGAGQANAPPLSLDQAQM